MIPAFPTFTPNNWYWTANDGVRVYSSAKNALVYPYDTGYLSFVAQQGGQTPWPVDISGNQTTAALAQVMAAYGITLSFS
jgi:sarcosine oxidase gamma subunit